MRSLDGLLTVQAHDTKVDQLRHRQSNLPERARLAELVEQEATIEREIAATTAQRDDLSRAQRRLEDEVAAIEDKRISVDKTLYSGAVTNPRELQALQDELAALSRRQSHLEDQVLELMEGIEPLEARLVELQTASAANSAQQTETAAALASVEADIRAELATEVAARGEAVAAVGPELLDEYEHLRARSGGVAVARLVGSQCGGCHLTLSAVELARIKKLPADAVVHCDECGRLLVH